MFIDNDGWNSLGRRLTEREITVLKTVLSSRNDSVAAEKLGITEASVRRHIRNIYARLGAREWKDLMHRLMDEGIDLICKED